MEYQKESFQLSAYVLGVNSNKSDDEKKAAKDFLNWLYTSDEGKKIIIEDCGFIPKTYKGI